MVIEIIGFTLDTLGKILVAISVVLVHSRIMKEHKIDRVIIKEMRKEKQLAIIGILLIFLGYLLQLPSKV